MANRVTSEDIIRINESYYKNKTYAATARETGFSASTVKKYVIPGWEPPKNVNIKKFDPYDIPPLFNREIFRKGDILLTSLSEEEKKEMKELWKELVI